MTLHEVIDQVYSLSVGGCFNRDCLTKAEFAGLIKAMFRCVPADAEKTIVEQIGLSDGWWEFEIRKFVQNGRVFYDYSIPETREQEKRILARMMERYRSAC